MLNDCDRLNGPVLAILLASCRTIMMAYAVSRFRIGRAETVEARMQRALRQKQSKPAAPTCSHNMR
jgi:hypothetical protein